MFKILPNVFLLFSFSCIASLSFGRSPEPLRIGWKTNAYPPPALAPSQTFIKFPASADLGGATFERLADTLLRAAAHDYGDAFYLKQINLRLNPKKKNGVYGVNSLNLFGQIGTGRDSGANPNLGIWVNYGYSDQDGYQKEISNEERDIAWGAFWGRNQGKGFFSVSHEAYELKKTCEQIFTAMVNLDGSSFDELIIVLRPSGPGEPQGPVGANGKIHSVLWAFDQEHWGSFVRGDSNRTGFVWDESGEMFGSSRSRGSCLPGLQPAPGVGPVRPHLP